MMGGLMSTRLLALIIKAIICSPVIFDIMGRAFYECLGPFCKVFNHENILLVSRQYCDYPIHSMGCSLYFSYRLFFTGWAIDIFNVVFIGPYVSLRPIFWKIV